MKNKKTYSTDDLKSTHQKLAYIHQILTQSQTYRVEEFDYAKECILMITEMANKIAQQLESISKASEGGSNE